MKQNLASNRGFNAGLLSYSLYSTTNMECAHGQLSTWLTDRLGGDNADSFTFVDLCATRQVATVASSAHALLRFAGQNGANLRLFHLGFFDDNAVFLDDRLSGLDQHLTSIRVNNVFRRGPAKDAVD